MQPLSSEAKAERSRPSPTYDDRSSISPPPPDSGQHTKWAYRRRMVETSVVPHTQLFCSIASRHVRRSAGAEVSEAQAHQGTGETCVVRESRTCGVERDAQVVRIKQYGFSWRSEKQKQRVSACAVCGCVARVTERVVVTACHLREASAGCGRRSADPLRARS
jgi:hypothetical protein